MKTDGENGSTGTNRIQAFVRSYEAIVNEDRYLSEKLNVGSKKETVNRAVAAICECAGVGRILSGKNGESPDRAKKSRAKKFARLALESLAKNSGGRENHEKNGCRDKENNPKEEPPPHTQTGEPR